MSVGELVTLKVRNVDRTGKLIKGSRFVSGTVLAEDARSVTVEVTTHDDWHGTSSVRAVRIDRKRITKSVGR